jgi:hypothetical protein
LSVPESKSVKVQLTSSLALGTYAITIGNPVGTSDCAASSTLLDCHRCEACLNGRLVIVIVQQGLRISNLPFTGIIGNFRHFSFDSFTMFLLHEKKKSLYFGRTTKSKKMAGEKIKKWRVKKSKNGGIFFHMGVKKIKKVFGQQKKSSDQVDYIFFKKTNDRQET